MQVEVPEDEEEVEEPPAEEESDDSTTIGEEEELEPDNEMSKVNRGGYHDVSIDLVFVRSRRTKNCKFVENDMSVMSPL